MSVSCFKRPDFSAPPPGTDAIHPPHPFPRWSIQRGIENRGDRDYGICDMQLLDNIKSSAAAAGFADPLPDLKSKVTAAALAGVQPLPTFVGTRAAPRTVAGSGGGSSSSSALEQPAPSGSSGGGGIDGDGSIFGDPLNDVDAFVGGLSEQPPRSVPQQEQEQQVQPQQPQRQQQQQPQPPPQQQQHLPPRPPRALPPRQLEASLRQQVAQLQQQLILTQQQLAAAEGRAERFRTIASRMQLHAREAWASTAERQAEQQQQQQQPQDQPYDVQPARQAEQDVDQQQQMDQQPAEQQQQEQQQQQQQHAYGEPTPTVRTFWMGGQYADARQAASTDTTTPHTPNPQYTPWDDAFALMAADFTVPELLTALRLDNDGPAAAQLAASPHWDGAKDLYAKMQAAVRAREEREQQQQPPPPQQQQQQQQGQPQQQQRQPQQQEQQDQQQQQQEQEQERTQPSGTGLTVDAGVLAWAVSAGIALPLTAAITPAGGQGDGPPPQLLGAARSPFVGTAGSTPLRSASSIAAAFTPPTGEPRVMSCGRVSCGCDCWVQLLESPKLNNPLTQHPQHHSPLP
jgi:hypothetical protein